MRSSGLTDGERASERETEGYLCERRVGRATTIAITPGHARSSRAGRRVGSIALYGPAGPVASRIYVRDTRARSRAAFFAVRVGLVSAKLPAARPRHDRLPRLAERVARRPSLPRAIGEAKWERTIGPMRWVRLIVRVSRY